MPPCRAIETLNKLLDYPQAAELFDHLSAIKDGEAVASLMSTIILRPDTGDLMIFAAKISSLKDSPERTALIHITKAAFDSANSCEPKFSVS